MDLKFLESPTLAVYNNLSKNHLHIMARTGDLNKGLIKFVFNLEQKPVSK